MPGGRRREPVDHDELAALVLADLPPMTKFLRILQMAGLGTAEALDKLGVRRENRSRVIAGKTGHSSPGMQKPKS